MTLPEDIYSQRILELAAAMPRTARLAMPEATATAHSKLCGSTVTVDLAMEGDVVTDYGQKREGLPARPVGGLGDGPRDRRLERGGVAGGRRGDAQDAERGRTAAARQMGDLAVLEPVRDYKARHASTLLVFDAVEDAIAKIEAKRAAGACARKRMSKSDLERRDGARAARRADRQGSAACADCALPLHDLAAARRQLPASAVLLGLCARGDREERRLERRLARARQALPLPSVGQPRLRSGARLERRASSLRAVALRTVARLPRDSGD